MSPSVTIDDVPSPCFPSQIGTITATVADPEIPYPEVASSYQHIGRISWLKGEKRLFMILQVING